MELVVHAGVAVDRCTHCGGIWFDAREKERLLAAHGAEQIDTGDVRIARQLDQLRAIECPRCDARMVRMTDVRKPDVKFEQCAGCGGSFLDAGELRLLEKETLGELLRALFA